MKLSQEKIKEILDNAPSEAVYWYVNDSGAPSYDPINVYYDEHFNNCHKCGTSLREDWHVFPIKLSDLSAQLQTETPEEREVFEAMAQLEPEQEWKNGDEVVAKGVTKTRRWYVGRNPKDCSWHVTVDENGYTDSYKLEDLSKPETPEQKAAKSLTAELWGKKLTSDASQVAELIISLGYRKESK